MTNLSGLNEIPVFSSQGFSSHVASSIPATPISMLQQALVAQMYPQGHLSRFANNMPYRQLLSPVYVPPMVMPGYSSSLTTLHIPNTHLPVVVTC